MNGFDAFWSAYPRKVGKLAAMKAYQRARTVATAEEILAGVALYLQHKPDYADWCHPTTFLTQGRWMDDYTPTESQKPKPSAYQPYIRLADRSHG